MAAERQQSDVFPFRPLGDLKEIMEGKGIRLSRPSPASRQAEPESGRDDNELFLEAMKEVREIAEFRRLPVRRKRCGPLRAQSVADSETVKTLRDLVAGRGPLYLPHTQEYVQWINPAYKGDILGRLSEGRFAVQDCLDLHGLVVAEAETEVRAFIEESLKKGYHCVKIIHGRGLRSPNGPVLKQVLLTWLSGRFRKHLIAFVTARQCDGGLGALYVLLR
jgi:DNA-nicking Smr family endonuclease